MTPATSASDAASRSRCRLDRSASSSIWAVIPASSAMAHAVRGYPPPPAPLWRPRRRNVARLPEHAVRLPPPARRYPRRGGVDTPASRSMHGTACAGQQPSDRPEAAWGADVEHVDPTEDIQVSWMARTLRM